MILGNRKALNRSDLVLLYITASLPMMRPAASGSDVQDHKFFNKQENTMEKITSFTIDHIKLQPGLYVSRKDRAGDETITTFDLRLTSPNDEPVLNTAEVHTI